MKAVKSKSVVLLYNIPSLGKSSSVVEVKPGYAKNYLIPRGLAMYATANNIKNFEKNKELIMARHSQKYDLALKARAMIENKSFTFVCNASDDGRLYGSVSIRNIVEKINEEISKYSIDFTIVASSVNVGHGIKFLGQNIAKISLYDDILCEVNIVTCRSEADVQSYFESEKKS